LTWKVGGVDSGRFSAGEDQWNPLPEGAHAGTCSARQQDGDPAQPARAALVHSLQQVWTQIARNPTSQMGKISPNIGSVVAREFEAQRQTRQKLPGFISLNGGSTVSAGYFNARYTPFAITASSVD
jgi:hypothetical protein